MTAAAPRSTARLLLLLACGLAAGCASTGAATVVELRDLDEASGSPRISAVLDVGGVDIPALGTLRPQRSDGAAVIGETLWIQGSSFGRQPTVSVGGRVAAVVSRTADGGILVRVPPGTPSGPQSVLVRQEHGQASFTIPVRRLGGVIAGGRLAFFTLEPGGARALPAGPRPGFRQLQISPDGRAGYALDQSGTLRVFELPASGGPSEIGRVELGADGSGDGKHPGMLLAAAAAPRLVLLRKQDLVVLEASTPLHPRRLGTAPWPLPAWLRNQRILRASLSPDARWLALALAERNRVVLVAVDRLGTREETRAGDLPLMPEVLAPSLVDLTFAPDARTLWVLSGLTDDNRALGPRPTEVHALRVEHGGEQAGSGPEVQLQRARVVVLPDAHQPVALSTGRNLPLASGSAVRLPPERATVFVAARAGRTPGQPTIYAVGESDTGSALLAEADLRRGGRLDVTPDGTLVLGAFLDSRGDVRVAAAAADGRPRRISSAVVVPSVATGPDDSLGETELRVQP